MSRKRRIHSELYEFGVSCSRSAILTVVSWNYCRGVVDGALSSAPDLRGNQITLIDREVDSFVDHNKAIILLTSGW